MSILNSYHVTDDEQLKGNKTNDIGLWLTFLLMSQINIGLSKIQKQMKGISIYWMTLGFKKTSADWSNGLDMKFNRNKHRVL